MVLVLVVCVGRHAGLILGSVLSLEPRSWLSVPDVTAGGCWSAVIDCVGVIFVI